ncbi:MULTISPECIES: phosphate ABC transporter permease PstA [Culturomica]|jgi:phosphate transport system permease protein|uniref:phosphate ABC transporter permease PstA n=1 Tax=Culturomica TaxID=1926651 RepID=UPI0003393209|nr:MULTISPECIES: phosphate ABC transporter permease PstA [Odoribacteraceae]RHV92673.1 phosphate ABC transporter permease PstA [Odoribacter sp. OF09-27XD]CCZ09602.1 phosphate ABC transporter permease PstA [Odoribacter sp. CAG:788]HBO25713.1 phosphate ABC transporter permease PtsA [Culturomica sp.]
MSALGYRTFKDRLFFWSVCFFASLTAIPLFLIIWEVVKKGYKQINLRFFVETAPSTLDAMLARNSGELIPGGIANGITGTLMMVAMASAIAIPVGILGGVYLAEKPKAVFTSVIRFLTDLVQGSPSIVIGIIAYSWVVKPLGSYSAIAGSTALAIMMLPLIIRSTEETLKMLPGSLKEAGLALGCSYTSVVIKVLIPSAFGGLFTGILLAISRVMGETAPLMLTALGSSAINWDVLQPTSAVPLLIWEFYNDPNLIDMIWSSSLFLLLLILVLNIIAKQVAKKWKTA